MCNQREEPFYPLRVVFGFFSKDRLHQAEKDLDLAGIRFVRDGDVPSECFRVPVTIPSLTNAFPELRINAIMQGYQQLQRMNVVMALRQG